MFDVHDSGAESQGPYQVLAAMAAAHLDERALKVCDAGSGLAHGS